ncbi:phytoene desaturase family protein [Microbacterium sp. NPDC055665]
MSETPDVVVVGSGPNGLAAAVTMARAGLRVQVFEQSSAVGGGARTAELTLPGFLHDVCSAVHPMALASPFFEAFELAQRVEFVTPSLSYAHLAPSFTGVAYRELERTADALGRDGRAWTSLMEPLVRRFRDLADLSSAQLLRVPPSLSAAALLGRSVAEQGSSLGRFRFRDEVAPALLAGVGAHAIQPFPSLGAAAVGLVLGAHAHAGGWPIAIGGSRAIVDSLEQDLVRHGGELVFNHRVGSLRELPPARCTLLDVSARSFVSLADGTLPAGYSRRLERFRYGPGVAKVDFALSAPVPWSDVQLADAGTIHIGGSAAHVRFAEREIARGRHVEEPFVLVSQPTRFDATRAPEGKHVLWAYAHVPAGSTVDQLETIVRLVERHAPGFRDVILATHSSSAADLGEYNPNYVGGDIAAGASDLRQLVARPTLSTSPWSTPVDGVYLCSSSTAPGPGVHGLCGWNAAKAALRTTFGLPEPSLGIV